MRVRPLSAGTINRNALRVRWLGLGVAVGMLAGGAGTAPASHTSGAVFEVGAATVDITPQPPAGRTWQTQGCFEENANTGITHALPTRGHGWPLAQQDCIYLGGFGIGPARAATGVDDGGVWVRAIAIGNGTQTFAYAVIDAVGYFARYQDAIANGVPAGVCSDCGMLDIRESLFLELGIPVQNIVLTSTHTHSGPDGYGGWGGLPDWYWLQLRDSFKQAVRDAVGSMRAAKIDVGAVDLRARNGDRRDTYYSATDYGAVWLQAREVANPARVIATLLNFAGHPTILNEKNKVLHADWPGATARRFEALYDDDPNDAYRPAGLVFEGGLGNISISGVGGATKDIEAENTGIAIADDIAKAIADDPYRLDTNTMTADIRTFEHPIMTNKGLSTLASLGLFSREFIPETKGAAGPGAYKWSRDPLTNDKGEPKPGFVRGCETASEIQVITSAGAHKIGEFGIAFGPGEVFSNLTITAKAKLRNNVVLAVFGQANDALGYIMQSFEYDYAGAGAAGEYGTQHGEYEEVFAVDHCIGDHVIQTIIDAGRFIGL